MTVEKKTFNHIQLMAALYFMYDLFSRPNIPFFLLDETAKNAKELKKQEGEGVTVGIRDLDAQHVNFSIMDAFRLPDSRTDKEIKYTVDNVPVTVKIVKNAGHMFTALDTFLYERENFCVPNPFKEYWQIRENI